MRGTSDAQEELGGGGGGDQHVLYDGLQDATGTIFDGVLNSHSW